MTVADRLPEPDAVAAAFALGAVDGEAVLLQHTSFRTFRLATEAGPVVIKELWRGDEPAWAGQLDHRCEFESRAVARGVDAPGRFDTADGPIARLPFGGYRAHELVESRPPVADAALADWLGRALALLHSTDDTGLDPGLAADWFGLHPDTTWHGWAASALDRGADWAEDLSAALPGILRLRDRVADEWAARDDLRVSHGDLAPSNVLVTARGPVLIDWDSVSVESAGLEVGRTLLEFAPDDAAFARRVLAAYEDAGGVPPALDDRLGLRLAAGRLGNLALLIGSALGASAPTGWMAGTDVGRAIRSLDRDDETVRRLATALRG